jgi:GT2 family glycosyltransferase
MCKPNKLVLGVSIVTYNTSIEEVREILRILKDVPEIAQITIIDNSDQQPLLRNSIDITGDETKTEFFKNDKNVGYVAHNIGMMKSIENDLDYHLVINSDLIFDGITVSKLLKVMEKNKNIGLIMPKILNYDGTDQHLAKNCQDHMNCF